MIELFKASQDDSGSVRSAMSQLGWQFKLADRLGRTLKWWDPKWIRAAACAHSNPQEAKPLLRGRAMRVSMTEHPPAFPPESVLRSLFGAVDMGVFLSTPHA